MADWKKKRKQNTLELRDHNFLIFCEGEKTEPNYFEGFKTNIEKNPVYRKMVMVEILGLGKETLRVVEEAKEFVQKNKIRNSDIYCVFDKDSFPASDFNEAICCMNELNKNDKGVTYHAAWSNQCIELWFLLHFSYYQSNNDRTQYMEALNKEFKKFGFERYEKNNDSIFNILYQQGNPKNSVRFAKKLIEPYLGSGTNYADMAPATMVYELVEESSKYLPEEMKKHFVS
ncbi:RloB family protein [Faecalicoccus acidiformans]|uniref:RloB domain-containing protein n=1 Tax=Faecalicoccus acidiformans TaxID=915173 RepID=A0ABS2FQJ6_9FIRM|nr:RloB family protein [Faecalicoccus acidiformans]MBM6831984.1 RloB domain-containing protein [Faecalicoccus acidiformans]